VFSSSDDDSDILSCKLGSNGDTDSLSTLVYSSACGETWGRSDSDYRYTHPEMLGTKVFKCAVKGIKVSINEILETAQKNYDDVDWFLPHQANHNINAFVASSLGSEVEVRTDDAPLIKDKRWLSNIEKYGNLSAASIPMLFHENIKNGKIKRGDLCVMAAYGAGFNWGGMLLRY
jgi:3-oxoacyl-[acyl-carrier-protein] synthase-3